VADPQDVVIIGGGVLGAACARELARAGRTVTVLEPDDRPGQAWRASAGLLAPQIDAQVDDPLLELGIAGREYWRERAAELRDETGIDVELFDGGILRLARGESEVDHLRSQVALQRQHGHQADWLDPAEVRSDWPGVGAMDGAFWAPHDGSVNPVRLVEALRASAAAAGARFVPDAAVGLETNGTRVLAARGTRGSYPTSDVVLAAGAWTGRLAGLPRPVSVEPVRGQMLSRPWPPGVRPGIVYGRHCYVLPRGAEAVCGATMEHAGFDAEVTDAGRAFVEERTTALLPALAGQPVARAWAGLRPATPDGLPIVGREPSKAGLWYATGHGRNGILLAGITAVILCHLMAGEATFEGADALRPERFWGR
jgi:glycine oxidase